ncbi:hypothetical protein [Photobacterium sp. TY1-4]|uniref:hypothetical protein n=1 Tax=Photobacterium sp. TY1-4 TaxID=2899122 RepID=UPI0021BE19FA|nr:hypothetical protein [Photobacterium sp. TY1-4]UXI04649.1 hypothetical protein NH461_16590 [Photobacterium sp. TY1-4]
MKVVTSLVVVLTCLSVPAHASWEKLKETASDIGDKVSEGSKKAWDNISEFSKEAWESVSEWGRDAFNTAGEWTEASIEKGKAWLKAGEEKLDEMLAPETPEEARLALDTMSDTALVRLFNEHPNAKLLFDQAYGYAVFDSRQFSLVLHTNQGAGVAVNRQTEKRTYMKMYGAGLALGIGGKFYQQVILFQDRRTFENFVQDGWEATSEIGVVAGTEGAELTSKYNGGMAIYQIDEKGLLLDANIAGSKYWIDTDLSSDD